MQKAKHPSAFSRFVFLVYCGFMLWLLFGRAYGWVDGLRYEQMLARNINLTPFLTIRNYLYVIFHSQNERLILHCVINLLGNVLLFIPAGDLMPKIWKRQRNFFVFFFTCAVAILLIEFVQLFTLLGSFDVDDIILNLLGMLLGFLFYHLRNLWKKQ